MDASSDSSSSRPESMQGSEDDVVLLSESSEIMPVDHSPSHSPKLERSPPGSLQKRRLQPSKHPVITDFFTSGPSEKKKRPRKRGIVPNEKTSGPKHSLRRVRARGNALCYHALFLFEKIV